MLNTNNLKKENLKSKLVPTPKKAASKCERGFALAAFILVLLTSIGCGRPSDDFQGDNSYEVNRFAGVDDTHDGDNPCDNNGRTYSESGSELDCAVGDDSPVG